MDPATDTPDQQAALLNQDEVYAEHVTDFFAERSYPELSWMHHVARRRFGDSAHALKQVQAASTVQADRMVRTACLAALIPLRIYCARVRGKGDPGSPRAARAGCEMLIEQLFDSIGKLAAVVELRTNGPTSYGADLLPGMFSSCCCCLAASGKQALLVVAIPYSS